MILSELRDYIRQQHRVSLKDLAMHFNVEADAMRGMLTKWINKGSVRKLSQESSCGTSCCKCDPAMTELYEWIDNSR